MFKIDVLNLEYTSYSSRDTEPASLICNYLRMQGLKVVEGCVFNGFALVAIYRPRVLYIHGVEGANINAQVAVWAKLLGCKVVSSCGEGLLNPHYTAQEILGLIRRDLNPLDLWCTWNKSYHTNAQEKIPEIANKMFLSGSAGHDRYKIIQPKGCALVPAQYKLCIGVGCWSWRDKSFRTEEQNAFFREEGFKFEQELKKIISLNPDIFFVLKEHPGSHNLHDSGIEQCASLPNVLVTKQAPITDCLEVADIWLSVESNTSAEAWLMGKPTAILNPSGVNWPFHRQNFFKGQPNFATAEAWTEAIKIYRETGELPGFAELASEREKILVESIGYADGFNHVRIGNRILDIQNTTSTVQLNDHWKKHLKHSIVKTMYWYFSKYYKVFPKSSKHYVALKHAYEDNIWEWNQKEREDLSKVRFVEQEDFYKKSNVTLEELRKIY